MALTDLHQPGRRRQAQKGTTLWTVNDILKDDKASVNVGARHGFVYDATHQQPIRRDSRQTICAEIHPVCCMLLLVAAHRHITQKAPPSCAARAAAMEAESGPQCRRKTKSEQNSSSHPRATI